MTRRTLLGGCILLVWFAMMGWQFHREYMHPELTRIARATGALDPATHFYAVRMGGKVVGIATSRLDTVPQGFVLEERLNLELTAMAQEGAATAATTVHLSRALQMMEFSFGLSSDAGDFTASGRVEGDSLLSVAIDAGAGIEELAFRFGQAPLSAAALPIRVAMAGELRAGRTLRLPVFDPSTVSTRVVELEVVEEDMVLLPDSAAWDPDAGRWVGSGEREVRAWHLKESYGGITVESWVDDDGRIIRSSSAMGLSLERLPFELVEQERGDARGRAGSPATDVIFSTAIAASRELGEEERRDEIAFVLGGVDLSGFALQGGRQELRGDTLVVRRERWEELDPGYSLPYPRMDLAESLQPEPLIQSGDERIIRAARALAGRGAAARDPVQVAERLVEAVYSSLEKEITFSLPSAVQVLESMRGDCNEHTVLYVALARALGLPARAAVGLVYLEGSFYYHAWPEVWLGEWVAVDPTFGETPAGAAHLRFVTGGLAQQVEVARLIGNLRIEAVGS